MAVENLQADIAWHRNQIRLAEAALAEADDRSNPVRAVEVGALRDSVSRLKLTLRHLEEILQDRSTR